MDIAGQRLSQNEEVPMLRAAEFHSSIVSDPLRRRCRLPCFMSRAARTGRVPVSVSAWVKRQLVNLALG